MTKTKQPRQARLLPKQNRDMRGSFNLCEQASVEQDPVKLQELVKEIDDLSEAKNARSKDNAPPESV
jgi:hypothetical protein